MFRVSNVYSFIVILVFALLPYFNTFAGSFHYDDYVYIVNNEAFKEYINHPFSVRQTLSTLSNRSVVLDSLYLNYSLGGFNVFGFHVLNITIHALTSLLIFIFLKSTVLFFQFSRPRNNSNVKVNIPLIASLLFAVHPINSQAVTYISNRSTLIATCCYLFSFLFFIKGILQSHLFTNSQRKEINFIKVFLFYFLSITFLLVGYGSKLIIITAPVLFVVYYLFFILQRSLIKSRFLNKLSFGILLGFLASPLFLIYLSKYINPQWLAGLKNTLLSKFLGQVFMTFDVTKDHFSSTIYLLTEFKVIVFYYLKMLILPFNQNVDPDFQISTGITNISTQCALFILLSILMLGIFCYKKKPLISFGIFWFYITLLPTSSIIPLVDTVAEHRVYLPSIGIVIIVSVILSNLYYSQQIKSAGRVINCLIFIISPIVLFSILTIQRNFIWKNEINLWYDAAKKSPRKPRVFNNLGEAYEKKEDYQKAIEALKKAIAISPGYDYAHNNLGTVYGKLNQIDLAIKEYQLVLNINNRFPTVHFNLGKAYEMKGMFDEAIQEYSLAIKQQSDFYQAYFNLANIFSQRNSYKKAISTYQQFLKYKPSHPIAHFELGNMFVKTKNLDKAFSYFSKAVKLNDNLHPAKVAMGNIFMVKGNFAKAEELYKQVLKIDPDNYIAMNNIGLIYLQHKKIPSYAVQYFRKSLKINPDQPGAKSIAEIINEFSQ